MPRLDFIPISRADRALLTALMNEERQTYLSDLTWDNSPIQQILQSFINQNLLPGYIVISDQKAVGYTYFLIHQSKGIIGTIYASRQDQAQSAADGMIELAIESLKETECIRRIEAQIMPFHNVNLTAEFTRHGFQYYERYFLELDLVQYSQRKHLVSKEKIIPWNSDHFSAAAEATYRSYQNQTDAFICEDYCSIAGCEGYLRSLIDNPGCGVFIPEGSFIGLDNHGRPCGLIISSRISSRAGMIPQISILPAYQGLGIGNVLMHRALSYFASIGFLTVGLTVTKKNRRAFEWYQRVGFRIKKEFGAYIWERTQPAAALISQTNK